MPECCNPAGYRHFFDQKEAQRSLRRYDKRGLDRMASSMVGYLKSRGMEGCSVLEAGGGIGAIQVELLKAGARSAVNVELSNGYERVAVDLLEREGLKGRVDRRVGDFAELAVDLDADDVVMNRVICCYPFVERLMGSAVSSSKRFIAATFPRDRLAAKIALSAGNAYCRIRRVDFRSFIHPIERIVSATETGGFTKVFENRDFVWSAVVWERVKDPGNDELPTDPRAHRQF